MKVILDTNLLITQVRDKVDLFEDINHSFEGKKQVIILKNSLDELKKLKNEGVEDAGLALENVLKQKIKILDKEIKEDVDSNILSVAEKQNAFIATNDKVLRKRAKQRGLPVLVFNKSKKRLIRA